MPDYTTDSAPITQLRMPVPCLDRSAPTVPVCDVRLRAGRHRMSTSPRRRRPLCGDMFPRGLESMVLTKVGYNIPPTKATSAFVPSRTCLSAPRQGRAWARSPSTSAPRRCRRSGHAVARKKESSVSKFAEREFRLVEPKRVRQGSAVGLGRSQIPSRGGREREDCDRRSGDGTFGMICPAISFPFIQLHARFVQTKCGVVTPF